MKALLIDTSYIEYSREFVKSCRKIIDITVVRKYYTDDIDAIPMFYKYSERMRKGKIRKFVRVIEYCYGYFSVLKYVKKNYFDVVHIQWPQIPPFDRYIFRRIKKYCGKLVYTAHDVIPHESTERKIKSFGKLYLIPDKIIVHGKYCENEFRMYYPSCYKKLFIQKHGVAPIRLVEKNNLLFEKHSKLKKLANNDKIVFAFIGQISPYKGLDLLLNAWKKIHDNENVFLLVVGKTTFWDEKTSDCMNFVKDYDNVYIYNEKYSDEEEVFFHKLCDVVVLPYRAASMSGVFFTATRYEKAILSTKVGCLTEYLDSVIDFVFTCEPTIESISDEIQNILNNYDKEKIHNMGNDCANQIQLLYNWDMIIKNLVENCYRG